MRRLAHWLRGSWGALVVLLVSVVVAGSLLRIEWGGGQSGATYRTTVGVTTRLSDAERVVVTGVRLAGRIQEGSRITISTGAVFLVVDYTIAVDDVPYGVVTATLLAGGRTYSSYTSTIARPGVGFQRQEQLVYEIALDDLAGAEVQLYTARDLRDFERIVLVDLGLSRARVDELAASRYQTVTVGDGADEVQR